MAGLVPAIHDFLLAVRKAASSPGERKQSVDGRHKAGHDGRGKGMVGS
jgi:hypothetical protein